MPISKFSEETRLKVVHAYLSGKHSLAQICAEHEHLNRHVRNHMHGGGVLRKLHHG